MGPYGLLGLTNDPDDFPSGDGFETLRENVRNLTRCKKEKVTFLEFDPGTIPFFEPIYW